MLPPGVLQQVRAQEETGEKQIKICAEEQSKLTIFFTSQLCGWKKKSSLRVIMTYGHHKCHHPPEPVSHIFWLSAHTTCHPHRYVRGTPPTTGLSFSQKDIYPSYPAKKSIDTLSTYYKLSRFDLSVGYRVLAQNEMIESVIFYPIIVVTKQYSMYESNIHQACIPRFLPVALVCHLVYSLQPPSHIMYQNTMFTFV